MYYTQEQIDRANQADLVLFLQSQGEPLERAGQEYRWKRHDSLTVRGNKWYRHSQSKGGGPVDFVMEFFGKSFTEAVELLTGEKGAAPPPDRPSPATFSDFRLPPRSPDNRTARNYLTAARRIDEDVSGFFFSTGDIYEEAAHHNAVFVGRDESGVPRYAHQRGTAGSFRLDVKGSDKTFNFCYRGEGERLFVFEAPVDLLSFLCLFKKDWQKQSYLSLGGVGDKALLRFLSDRPNIKTVYLCLDNDNAGNDTCSRLAELVPEGLTVHRLVPLYKDWNEVLQHRAEIADGKYIREAIYGLKEPTQEETVEIIRMSEVDTQTVEWLWEPYIPFGKVTIVQGNPGEGKTTFALRLAAACTTGGTLPGMKPLPPFQVIYQTAEDGLGDTVKPRLIEAEADLDRVLVIDEAKRELTLSDERIEKAIIQNGARLIILSAVFAIYVKPPVVPFVENPFSHIFENAFIKAPLLYAVALSLWRGIVSLFVMTFGFVLALYCKNIFVILTGPFMYSILENFVLAILRLERLRLVVAFDPTTINPEVVSIFSFFFGPIVLSIVIGLTAFLLSKKNAIVTI